LKAIITVIGKDQIGIIAGTSNVLSDLKVNILDISQTILESYFTMIMLVDLSSMEISFSDLKTNLDNKGKLLGVSIIIQHEDIFNTMHNL